MTDELEQARVDTDMIRAEKLLEQPDFITGYQYKANGRYNGIYRFPNNKDKEEVHLPPMTTLVAPPPISDLAEGMEHAWDGTQWVQRPWTKPETIPVETRTEPDSLPMPSGPPPMNEHGAYPRCVLNAAGTAYEWVYPEPTLFQKIVATVKGALS